LSAEGLNLLSRKFQGNINHKSYNLPENVFRSLIFLFKKAVGRRKERIGHRVLFCKYEAEKYRALFDDSDNLDIVYRHGLGIDLNCLIRCLYLIVKYIWLYPFFEDRERGFFSKCFVPYVEAYVYYHSLRKQDAEEVVFFGFSYDLCNFFCSFLISKDANIKSIFYEATFNPSYESSVFADAVILNNLWLRNSPYIERIYKCNRFFLGKVQNYNFITKNMIEISGAKNKIAYYSSGMYARESHRFVKEETLNDMIASEKRLIELIFVYAKTYRQIQFKIFTHPYGVEEISQSKAYYQKILGLSNVSIDASQNLSYEHFGEYELGFSSLSATIMERLSCGYKAAFVFPGNYLDAYDETLLSKVILAGDFDTVINSLEYYRNMPKALFFKEIGMRMKHLYE
jgi:hypothetical protein